MDLAARTRIATAATAREASDLARSLLTIAAEPHPNGALMATAQRLRTYALAVLDRAVLTELAAGATWDDVANALGMDVDQVTARYAAVYDRWVLTALDPSPSSEGPRDDLGLGNDPDPAGTAATLDAWLARHTDPWDTPAERGLLSLID